MLRRLVSPETDNSVLPRRAGSEPATSTMEAAFRAAAACDDLLAQVPAAALK